jgi:hypothetical protein
MSIFAKFGRWFVVTLWTAAGAFCLLNATVDVERAMEVHAQRIIVLEDVIYALAGIAFLGAAIGIARRLHWARQLSLGLWALFGYWDLTAMSEFADKRWFPLLGFASLVVALFWLISPAALR